MPRTDRRLLLCCCTAAPAHAGGATTCSNHPPHPAPCEDPHLPKDKESPGPPSGRCCRASSGVLAPSQRKVLELQDPDRRRCTDHPPVSCPYPKVMKTYKDLPKPGNSSPLLWYQVALAVCAVTLVTVLYTDLGISSREVVQSGLLHSTTATAPAGSTITARHTAAGKPQQQLECTTQTTYISSDFELAWLGNVTAWQDSFCEVVRTPQQQQWTKIWLDTIAAEASGKQDITYDPAVFSRFVTTRTCPGQQQQPQESITTWIEPLAHGLRHPNSLCNMGADLFDRGYLLVAKQKDVLALRAAATPSNSEACSSRSCQAIYMDLGATRWEAAPNSVGQAWFYRCAQPQFFVGEHMAPGSMMRCCHKLS